MAEQPQGETCENCRFLVKGRCRFNPPVLVRGDTRMGLDDRSEWVNVKLDDWCGQWAAVPAQKKR